MPTNFTFETQKPAETTNQDVHGSDYSVESHRIAVNLLAATLERQNFVLGGAGGKGRSEGLGTYIGTFWSLAPFGDGQILPKMPREA
jgi:hypothetical protein